MVRAQRELLRALGVERVRLVVGGSLGGMQVLEWALTYPELVEAIAPIATSARHSAWAIGLSEAQRQAIYADPRWQGGRYDLAAPPAAGLSAARQMAMLMYRHKASFDERFGRRLQGADLFAMESYLRYQGRQLVERFDAATYVALTRAMDTHDVARGRGDFEEVLRSIRAPALVVSIDSDVLYLPDEQQEIARGIPGARLVRLASKDGHDAFLIDVDWLSEEVATFRGRAPGRRSAIRSPTAVAAATAAAERQEVSLLVLGTGKVGGELLDQIARQRATLERDYDVALRVVGARRQQPSAPRRCEASTSTAGASAWRRRRRWDRSGGRAGRASSTGSGGRRCRCWWTPPQPMGWSASTRRRSGGASTWWPPTSARWRCRSPRTRRSSLRGGTRTGSTATRPRWARASRARHAGEPGAHRRPGARRRGLAVGHARLRHERAHEGLRALGRGALGPRARLHRGRPAGRPLRP